jgi:hypothetical protein
MSPEEFKDRLNTLEKEFKELYVRYAADIAGNEVLC